MAVSRTDVAYQETKDFEGYKDVGEDNEEEMEVGKEEEAYEDQDEPREMLTQEELEFLELREQLKAEKRREMRKDYGSLLGLSSEVKKLPYNNFGSFFGPSKSVIAQRVIQESKALLDIRHSILKASNFHHRAKKNSESIPSKTNPGLTEVEIKVQKLKDSRDYSFLFSEDAVLLACPSKEQSAAAQSAQQPASSKQTMNNAGGKASDSDSDKRRNFASKVCQLQPSSQPHEVSSAKRLSLTSTNPRNKLGSPNNNAIQHASQEGLDAKRPAATMDKMSGNSTISGAHRIYMSKSNSVNEQHLGEKRQYLESKKPEPMPNQMYLSLKHKVPGESKVTLSQSATKQHSKQVKGYPQPFNAKKMPNQFHSSSNNQVSVVPKASFSKSSVTKQQSEGEKKSLEPKKTKVIEDQRQSSLKHRTPDEHKACLPKSQSETKKQLEQGKYFHQSKAMKMTPNKLQSSSQHQVPVTHKASLSKSQSSTKQQMEQHKEFRWAKIKRSRQVLSDDDDNEDDDYDNDRSYVSDIIQGLFRKGRNRQNYRTVDYSDDGECMVASFADIEKEERKSAKIARQEDEIERMHIEQEEREERLRRKAKKQKLQQH